MSQTASVGEKTSKGRTRTKRAGLNPDAAVNGVVVSAGIEITPSDYTDNAYMHLLVKASQTDRRRFLLGLPLTGLVRAEFMFAKYSQTIPRNWSMSEHAHPIYQVGPIGYDVKDARNTIVHIAVTQGFEWLFFLDHDVLLPPDCFIKMNEYMRQGDIPIVSGLYFTKSFPAEPLVYRGRGNSYFAKWKLGDKVWCDGTGMGCTLISVKLLAEMYKDAPEYLAGGNMKVRRVFDTPQFHWFDPEAGGVRNFQGTEDLSWYDRVREGNYLAKAGFKKIAKQRYFALLDSTIACKHITNDGVQYPLEWRW